MSAGGLKANGGIAGGLGAIPTDDVGMFDRGLLDIPSEAGEGAHGGA